MENDKLSYKRQYDKFHPDGENHVKEMMRYNCSLLSEYIKNVSGDKNINILEIGCGRGYALLALKEMGYHNIGGIDIDQSQIDYCLAQGLPSIRVTNTEDFLSNHKGEYDFIFAIDVLEHIEKKELVQLIHGIHSALKNEGLFLCRVPNANHPLSARYRYIDWTHCGSFTECSLDYVLYQGGFGTISIKEEPYITPKENVLKRFCLKLLRSIRRFIIHMEYATEFGKEGFKLPITLNIIGIGKKE